MRIDPVVPGGELRHAAPPRAAFRHRPVDQLRAEPLAAQVAGNAHCLDLAAPRAAPGQARQEGKLQGADDAAFALGDDQHLVGVGMDQIERGAVAGVERQAGVLALCPAHIVGEQRDDRRQVVARRLADGESVQAVFSTRTSILPSLT